MSIGPAKAHVAYIDSKEDIEKALELAQKLNLAPYPLGGGSNTVFDDSSTSTYLFLIPRMKEVSCNDHTLVKIDAGTPWDEAVARTVKLGLTGLESLSGIPGLTGAGPVQNIGAYGAEIKDTIATVYAYDMAEKKFVDFARSECEFEYRSSVFKKNPGRYFIYAVTFSLSKARPSVPRYTDIILYFGERKISIPTLSNIREAILEIRSKKLPDPKETPNAGSYFKNPIVSTEEANALKTKFPSAITYPAQSGFTKLSAGWLIDQAGLKGVMHGNFGIHANHALVVIGNGIGTLEELLLCEDEIKNKVYTTFGVHLEREPVIVR